MNHQHHQQEEKEEEDIALQVGNSLYVAGNFREAINCYTKVEKKSIRLCCNISQAYLKLDEFPLAYQYASRVVKSGDDQFIRKGLYRKSFASFQILKSLYPFFYNHDRTSSTCSTCSTSSTTNGPFLFKEIRQDLKTLLLKDPLNMEARHLAKEFHLWKSTTTSTSSSTTTTTTTTATGRPNLDEAAIRQALRQPNLHLHGKKDEILLLRDRNVHPTLISTTSTSNTNNHLLKSSPSSDGVGVGGVDFLFGNVTKRLDIRKPQTLGPMVRIQNVPTRGGYVPLILPKPIEWVELLQEWRDHPSRTSRTTSSHHHHIVARQSFSSSSSSSSFSSSSSSFSSSSSTDAGGGEMDYLRYLLHYRGLALIRLPKSLIKLYKITTNCARDFFNAPSWHKNLYRFSSLTTFDSNKNNYSDSDDTFQGYITPAPGLHEIFELRRNGTINGYDIPIQLEPVMREQQHSSAPGSFDLSHKICHTVLEILSTFATGSAESWTSLLDNSTLRLINYDKINESSLPDYVIQRDHFSPHTDQGLLTLCPLSSFPGLEICMLERYLEWTSFFSMPSMREEVLEYVSAKCGKDHQIQQPNGEQSSPRRSRNGDNVIDLVQEDENSKQGGNQYYGRVNRKEESVQSIINKAEFGLPHIELFADLRRNPLPDYFRPKKLPHSGWYPIERISKNWPDDCLLLFCGDSLARLSNNYFPALMHRPNVTGCKAANPSRISCPFFLRTSEEAILDTALCDTSKVGIIDASILKPVRTSDFGDNKDRCRDNMPWKSWDYYSCLVYN